jgi:hypothetical protein
MKTQRLVARDTQRFEHGRRHPRQLGAGVDENVIELPPQSAAGGVLDLDRRAKDSHLVAHHTR